MPDKIESTAKKQVLEFLPRAIEKTLESYHGFMAEPKDSEAAKNFKDHQMACKVALAHIDLLLKLASWAEMPVGTSGESVADLTETLDFAKKEYGDHKVQEAGDVGGEDLA